MSNKTQLQTNNTALDALITRVNAAKDVAASLPEVGGGSGGSIDTCTVQITSSINAIITYLSCSVFTDGKISAINFSSASTSIPSLPYTIENVICGSAFTLNCIGAAIPGYDCDGIQQIFGGMCQGQVTAGAGETATIRYIDND